MAGTCQTVLMLEERWSAEMKSAPSQPYRAVRDMRVIATAGVRVVPCRSWGPNREKRPSCGVRYAVPS